MSAPSSGIRCPKGEKSLLQGAPEGKGEPARAEAQEVRELEEVPEGWEVPGGAEGWGAQEGWELLGARGELISLLIRV